MTGGLRRREWVAVAVMVAVWASAYVPALVDGLTTGRARVQVFVTSAEEGGHPSVWSFATPTGWDVDPKVGDEILAVDGRSLSGCAAVTCQQRIEEAIDGDGKAGLAVARDDERLSVTAQRVAFRGWWTFVPFSAALFLTALLLLLRAPGWHLSRRYLTACWLISILVLWGFEVTVDSRLTAAVSLVAWPVTVVVVVLALQEFTRSARPVPWGHRAAAVFAGCAYLASGLTLSFGTSRAQIIGTFVLATASVAVSALAGLTRAYRRADRLERRQMRWVTLGFYLTFAGILLNTLLLSSARTASPGVLTASRWVSAVLLLGVPAGVLISVIGYRWLDIDRLISATASSTIVGAGVAVPALLFIPDASESMADSLGSTPATWQTLFTLALVAVAVPGYRELWRRLDRRLFTDRHDRALGFDALLLDLGRCESADDLTRLVGERLDSLLGPISIAIYALDGVAFTPVFTRGQAVPPAFEVDSPLVRTLDQRARPLAADTADLDPFDRAALETLDVAVVVPTRRTDTLVSFTCLGRKASNDIYTPEDLAHLTAVANRSSEVLRGLHDEALIRESEQMQEALRGYVPGAVADALAAGRAPDSTEMEVTVLFVDIRGYTSFAEQRATTEVFTTINEYTERVSSVVLRHGGSVVEFHGDGMVAVFGAPDALEHKERAAVQAARDIVTVLPADIEVGVGIATGNAFVGNIRSTDRMIWTVIGTTPNLAARFQSLTRELGASIAVDRVTRERAGDVCSGFECHADLPVRGSSDRHEVWSLALESPVGVR